MLRKLLSNKETPQRLIASLKEFGWREKMENLTNMKFSMHITGTIWEEPNRVED